MSNRKSIVFLSLGLIVLLVANYALGRFGGVKRSIVRQATLVNPNMRVTELRITAHDGRSPVRLVNSSGWRLEEPFSAGVDEQVVMRLIDALEFTAIDDTLSDAELLKLGRTRADFGLETPAFTLSLKGSKPCELHFGAYTASSNGVYVAVSDVDAVFVVPVSVIDRIDVPAVGFRQRSICNVGPESVSAFEIKRGTGAILGFDRDGESWKVGDLQASAPKVMELLSCVMSAKAKEFVWPIGVTNESRNATSSLLAVYGLDPESAVTVTLKCVDGIDRQLSFGIDADDHNVYALVQNGGAIVTIDAKLRELSQQEPVVFSDSRLFPFEASAVRSFVISDGGATYVVARSEGGAWTLDSPVVAPADATTANAILDKVLALSSSDVRKDGIRVSVTTNANAIVVERRNVLGDLRLEDLRSKDILKVDPSLVKRIVRVDSSSSDKPSSVVYVRDRHVWQVDTDGKVGVVNEAGIASALSVLNPLQAEKVERLKVTNADLSAYGLETPCMKIAIDLEKSDAVRKNILIGSPADGNGSRFVTLGSSDAVFVISEKTFSSLTAEIISE